MNTLPLDDPYDVLNDFFQLPVLFKAYPQWEPDKRIGNFSCHGKLFVEAAEFSAGGGVVQGQIVEDAVDAGFPHLRYEVRPFFQRIEEQIIHVGVVFAVFGNDWPSNEAFFFEAGKSFMISFPDLQASVGYFVSFLDLTPEEGR